MEKIPRKNHRFLYFLLTFSVLGGVLLGQYHHAESQLAGVSRFSVKDLAKVNRLSRKLKQVEDQNVDLSSEIEVIRYKIHRQLGEIYKTEQRKRLKALSEYAGMMNQTGPGLEIVIRDSSRPFRYDENPNTGIIHNVDLLLIVNQLRQAGARAIAINDQRIVGDSEINCAGPIIIINKTRIGSPFVIRALAGEAGAEALLETMNEESSYLKHVSAYGIEITLEARDLEVPPYLFSNVRSMPVRF